MKKKEKVSFSSLLLNRRYLVMSVVGGLLIILILFSGFIPQINSLFELNDQINRDEKKLSALRQKAVDLENIEAQEAYRYVDSVDQILPSKKPLLELLTSLNMVATRNNVRFNNLSLTPGEIASESAEFLSSAKSSKKKRSKKTANQKEFDTLNVELEISGMFSDMQKFFLDIERVAPLITITGLSLDINSDNIVKSTDQVKAELVLSTYYFTQSVSAALETSLPNIGSREQEIITEIRGYSYPTVEAQQQVMGGGLEDLFGLSRQDFENNQLLNN
jgi:Tfp pilus assembly protein PilO